MQAALMAKQAAFCGDNLFKIRATRQIGRTTSERVGEARTVTGLRFATLNILRVLSGGTNDAEVAAFSDQFAGVLLNGKLAVGHPFSSEIAGVKLHITMDERNA